MGIKKRIAGIELPILRVQNEKILQNSRYLKRIDLYYQ